MTRTADGALVLTLSSTGGLQDGKMFYFYIQNRDKDPDAPLAIWLNGKFFSAVLLCRV